MWIPPKVRQKTFGGISPQKLKQLRYDFAMLT